VLVYPYIKVSDKMWILPTPGNKTQSLLVAAKTAKIDEFYTQWIDIEREMNAYLEYDPDVFRDRVILLPCDDPEWSNFTKFFALHFLDYGIKKLISTSYAADSKATTGELYQPTLLEIDDPQYDPTKTRSHGKKFVLERTDLNGDGVIDIDDLQWEYLNGDGDFRSDEVTALRDEADIVITNPPFSLFRPFIAWICDAGKKFAVIGNQNALTYRDIFPLIQQNRMWLGKGFPRNMAHFHTPYVPHGKWIEQAGEGIVRVPSMQWYTNLDHGRRHEPMQLMSMEDNIKFSKHEEVRGLGYQRYDNYDAIEVPFTDAIPGDYAGVMGVPITYLTKHNPDQFEIVGTAESNEPDNVLRTRVYSSQECRDAYFARFGKPGVYDLNASAVVGGVKKFKRILIRRKDAS
jgi:hypothetical protein